MNRQGLERGRSAFKQCAWRDAYSHLTAADARTPLDPDDLDRLATAAYLIGDDAAGVGAWTRAHAGFLERGAPIPAARSAFRLAFVLLERPSQRAQAAGWIARAQRLLDDVKEPCVEQGWLLCAAARQRVAAGDLKSAYASFIEATAIGERFGDRDLMALARHGQGRALLMLDEMDSGLALMDEVMIAVTGGEISPMVAGAVYCSVITACHDVFDLGRAAEWTSALQEWCDAQPELVPFRGYCLIRRSELMQLHGAWDEALDEARRACERLADPLTRPEAGAAYYQLAEVHRLRGDLAKADEAYRLASQAGRKPQPGFALLRLSQRDMDAADAAIRLALQETRQTHARVPLLSAAVEILVARKDITGARAAADELARLAASRNVPYLTALSSQACGAVALVQGEPLAALESLRAACDRWQELDVPYNLAQVRTLIGVAYRQLSDIEGAHLEFDAAHEIFQRLGAAPAAAHLAEVAAGSPPSASTTGLTGREIEVLRLVATGITNRAIAARLGISERTVDRHVGNIFNKLVLSSRAAATAYAYEHKLL